MGNSSSTASLKYEPQLDLLGSYKPFYERDSSEKLVATFRFMPCYWQKSLFRKKLFPADTGGIAGIGHLTNTCLVLFYDAPGALSQKAASGALSAADTVADLAGHHILGEVLSSLSHALSNISADTRKLMQKRAAVWTDPKGVAVLPYTFAGAFNMSKDYVGKTSDGTFFWVQDEHDNENFMFRPYYFGNNGHDDGGQEFEKILKSVGFYVKDFSPVY